LKVCQGQFLYFMLFSCISMAFLWLRHGMFHPKTAQSFWSSGTCENLVIDIIKANLKSTGTRIREIKKLLTCPNHGTAQLLLNFFFLKNEKKHPLQNTKPHLANL